MKLKVDKKSGLRYFSYADIKAWGPCYDPIKHIPADWRGTAVDVLKLEKVGTEDRLWVVLRSEIVSERVVRLFAVWCARRVQHLMKDGRSLKALDVAERFANGEASKEELSAARAAAWDAARAATRAAARDAARAAAWATAWAATRDTTAWDAQIKKLIEMVEAEGRERLSKRSR